MDNEYQPVNEKSGLTSVGTTLRICRESRGLSLEEAAEATKISKNFLRALEEDRLNDISSPAYLKGFIRTYSNYLGLEADTLVQLAIGQAELQHDEPVELNRKKIRIPFFNWQRLFLPAFLLGALIVSSFFISMEEPVQPRKTLPQLQPDPPVPAVLVQPAISTAQMEKTESTTINEAAEAPIPPETTPAATKQAGGFMIRMKVIRNSRLLVTIDDAVSQGYELTIGDLIEWKANSTIGLDLSDPAAVEIELNGTPVKLTSSSSVMPTYIVLNANGIKH